MFRVSTTLIIRSTQNCNYSLWYMSYFLCSYSFVYSWWAWPRWREVAAQKIWLVPEAVVTVLCTPDYRCGWHPKHVERTCRIINRLRCVASRWTIINIYQRCTEPYTSKSHSLISAWYTVCLFHCNSRVIGWPSHVSVIISVTSRMKNQPHQYMRIFFIWSTYLV